MIIFKSHSTHLKNWGEAQKLISSNHFNLTGSLREKHVTPPGIGPQNPMVYNLYLLYRTPEPHGIQPVPTLSNPRTPWYTTCTYSI